MKCEEDLDLDITEPEWHLLSELKDVEKNCKTNETHGIKWYENRVTDIEEIKRRIKNLEWLESFLKRFYGMYDIEFSVDYSEENLEKYEILDQTLCFNDGRVSIGFGLGKPKVNEERTMIKVTLISSELIKDVDFWNNYEIIFQQTKDDHLKKISQLISLSSNHKQSPKYRHKRTDVI